MIVLCITIYIAVLLVCFVISAIERQKEFHRTGVDQGYFESEDSFFLTLMVIFWPVTLPALTAFGSIVLLLIGAEKVLSWIHFKVGTIFVRKPETPEYEVEIVD